MDDQLVDNELILVWDHPAIDNFLDVQFKNLNLKTYEINEVLAQFNARWRYRTGDDLQFNSIEDKLEFILIWG